MAVQGGRAAARGLRRAAAAVVVGLVRARLQPVRAAEDRRIDQGAGEVAGARRPERRGAQDARAQPDDHRQVRRRPGRVRAGPPLQAGLRRDPLQPRQAVFDSGQLGAGAQGVRGGASARPVYVEALDALGFALEALGDDPGAIASYREGDRVERGAQGTSPRPREPERLLQPHGRSGKALDYARQALALDPKSDRAWFQKGRAEERQGGLDEAVERGEPRHRPEPSSLLVLLRAGRCLSPPRQDGREPEGARDIHPAGAGIQRARKEAARRLPRPGDAE